jgi:endonuclease/exonuclease/phosphatase family metal-dependent hydrolase
MVGCVKFFLMVVLFLLNSQFSYAAETLNILSMNVYMLPKPIKWSLQAERTQAIANQLENSNYDFIFFQEAFMPSFREEITKKLKGQYPYSYYLDKDGGFLIFFGSGLFVLSRYPMNVLEHVYFKDCGSFDCLAAKGSFLFESTLPSGKTIQFSTTHQQAGPENREIRLKQFVQIKALMAKHYKKDVTQFLIGDLNVDYLEPEYKEGLTIMGMKNAQLVGPIRTTNARTNDCYDTPTRKMWIDHVWMDQNVKSDKLEMQVKDFSFDYKGKSCPSSDHHGMESKISF